MIPGHGYLLRTVRLDYQSSGNFIHFSTSSYMRALNSFAFSTTLYAKECMSKVSGTCKEMTIVGYQWVDVSQGLWSRTLQPSLCPGSVRILLASHSEDGPVYLDLIRIKPSSRKSRLWVEVLFFFRFHSQSLPSLRGNSWC